MNCDPQSLIDSARCLDQCRGSLSAMQIVAVCAWANSGPVPIPRFSWEPPAALITWTDINGTFGPVDRATFFATADIPTVSVLALVDGLVTNISNISTLPALVNFTTLYNSGLTSLSFVGCSLLTVLETSFNALTSCDIAGCANLNFFDCGSNPLTVQSVNSLLSALAATGTAGGFLRCESIPPAPPSTGPPDGIAAKATLLAELPAWTVITD